MKVPQTVRASEVPREIDACRLFSLRETRTNSIWHEMELVRTGLEHIVMECNCELMGNGASGKKHLVPETEMDCSVEEKY